MNKSILKSSNRFKMADNIRFSLFTFLILILLAGGLRFYKLDWTFWSDEILTQVETYHYFENQPIPENVQYHYAYKTNQFTVLPRLIPVAHFIHYLDYKLFGTDEFGSRVLMATAGTLSVGLAFLLGQALIGYSAAVILALLLCFSPEHICWSQYSRFYITSFLCFEIVLLLGAYAAKYRSKTAAVFLGLTAVLAVFCNSFGGMIWGIVLLGLLAECLFSFKDKQKNGTGVLPRWTNATVIVGFWSVLLCIIAFVHILPKTGQWNGGTHSIAWNSAVSSGISPVGSLLDFAGLIGWAYFLLCVSAFLYPFLKHRFPGNAYWSGCVAATAIVIFILPAEICYFSYYNFLFMFPFWVILAVFLDDIRRNFAQSEIRFAKTFSILFCVLVLSFNVYALKEYYKDGNRSDWRTACQYVRQHWQEGDRIAVTGWYGEVIDRYLGDLTACSVIAMKTQNEQLTAIRQETET